MRLNKFIAQAGIASRRGSEGLIAQGRVQVNGRTVLNVAEQVEAGRDKVAVDGKILTPQPGIYIMLHKPAGYVSSCRRFKGEKSILELVKLPHRVYPVGRLDKDSAGLLILTNDGNMALRLSHPRYQQEKEYIVETDRILSKEAIARLLSGVDIGEGEGGEEVVKAKSISVSEGRLLRMVLTQGKKRQVRRMIMAVGARVVSLTRSRVKNLVLGDLALGQWRYLSREEIANME